MRFVLLCVLGIGCSEYSVVTKPPFTGASDSAAPDEESQDTSSPVGDSGAPDEETGDPPDTDPPDTDPPDTDPPDTPPVPDEFSLGWHILDEGEWVSTTTDPAHQVTYHGDTDSYWYEPSGNHGLIDSSDPDASFASMRDYVLERVPDPTHALGNLHYYADSDVTSFRYATFTYILCDFWVESGDDPDLYRLDTGPVDDGIEVLINGQILDFLRLDEGGDSWDLGDHIQLDSRNTLIVILVDNAERNKFIQDMAFWRGDIMVTGGPTPPPVFSPSH